MRKILINEATVKQVIAALEEPHPGIRTSFTDAIKYREKLKQAITAIKEALAQQEKDEFVLRGILAKELKCWHRLTADEAQNLMAFIQNMVAMQAQPEQEPNGLAAYVIGCFSAAEAEGLTDALAETTDERLKDLVERRLMYAMYEAQKAQPKEPEPEPVKIAHKHEWFRTGGMKVGQMRCISCGTWGQEEMPQRTWARLMRGVRAEGDTVVITVKGSNDAARELCVELLKEKNECQ